MPEIFLDAPHQVLPGKAPEVFLLVKDADLFPVTIRQVELHAEDGRGESRRREFPLDWKCDRNLMYRILAPDFSGLRGRLRIQGWITVEAPGRKSRRILNHNYPGLAPDSLDLRLLEHPLPHPADWKAGEMHCHSEFSSDPVEFGAPLELMQRTAAAVGLDFVLCTDHSYDFHYRRDRYTEPCDPAGNFAEYRRQADSLNAAYPASPTLIAGEEVSCGNARGENVHLLVFGHEHFLPGLGDGGRRGFRNRPDCALGEILERLGGVPAFAAHPRARIGRLERMLFRRGKWDDADAGPQRRPGGEYSIQGLQFWNGHLGGDYTDGKAFWVRQLRMGRRLLPIAASDAHGDFNRNIAVKLPLFSLRQGRDHVFGKARTLVPCAGKGAGELRRAFAGDRCACGDGPFADLRLEAGGLRVQARSSPDFGTLRSLCVYAGEIGNAGEKLLKEFTPDGMRVEEAFPAPGRGYVRAEVATDQGRRALTSALFLS